MTVNDKILVYDLTLSFFRGDGNVRFPKLMAMVTLLYRMSFLNRKIFIGILYVSFFFITVSHSRRVFSVGGKEKKMNLGGQTMVKSSLFDYKS